jgi:hypothetical protein
MNKNNLYRIAGWCALVTALLTVLIHLVPSGTLNIVGLILQIVILVGLTFVIYALFIAHRAESAGLSLAGLILGILILGLNLFTLVTNLNNTLINNVGTLLWSLPFLIFGFLAWRSTRMPRGLAVAALLTGISFLIATVAGMMGNEAVVNVVSLVADIFMLVWIVWLGIVFLSKKFASVAPVPVAA